MPPDYSQIAPFLIAALVVFAIYRRLRRNFGRQPLRPGRMAIRIVLLAAAACTLTAMALPSAQFLAAELSGAALGAALGFWGSERTRFEMFDGRMQYVPHTYTGIAVSLLFVGRLAFRMIQAYTGTRAHPAPFDSSQPFAPGAMLRSPLTVGIFFVLAGYYLCYYARILWKSKHLEAGDLEAVPQRPSI